ncbi:nucleotidyltransferase domain-containing protein [Deinococcus budaensis]|uniref:Cyclic GMP-AMP synthase n=1 Tax=Deinococcus budaensis TaxID=1665626 RepID=A0A7W8GCR0_9DEIO|nr:nucleotidyltransferase [Deinococcus budaensis]MBB5232973.1 hypothetical protein [Deinococcus budaensis]
MAQLQSQFTDFHDDIKLGTYEENETLRMARDDALAALRAGLRRLEGEREKKLPTIVETFGQGSYAMRTGILPLRDGDYDIDVAVVFAPPPGETLDDPVALKVLVRDALKGYARNVRIRQPCVTIERAQYHVDFAVYRQGILGGLDLARGKEHSLPAHVRWEPSDPRGLTKRMQAFYEEEERAQQRRVVRYLKRWRNVRLPDERIPGIALTLAVLACFRPVAVPRPWGQPPLEDDLAALLTVVEGMLGAFREVLEGETHTRVRRLVLRLPVQPGTDVLAQRTARQMQTFHDRLSELRAALLQAQKLLDPTQACAVLADHFGAAFPIPTQAQTSVVTSRAPVIRSGNQG